MTQTLVDSARQMPRVGALVALSQFQQVTAATAGAWSAPPAITVKAAAKHQEKHNDDQQEFHSILQNRNIAELLLIGGFEVASLRGSEST